MALFEDIRQFIAPPIDGAGNPFAGKRLRELCTLPVRKLARFYKICVSLPVM